jgi:hypothetical protein
MSQSRIHPGQRDRKISGHGLIGIIDFQQIVHVDAHRHFGRWPIRIRPQISANVWSWTWVFSLNGIALPNRWDRKKACDAERHSHKKKITPPSHGDYPFLQAFNLDYK